MSYRDEDLGVFRNTSTGERCRVIKRIRQFQHRSLNGSSVVDGSIQYVTGHGEHINRGEDETEFYNLDSEKLIPVI